VRKQWKLKFARDGAPRDVRNIGADGSEDDRLIRLAMKLYGDQGDIGFVDNAKNFYELWQLGRSADDKDVQLQKLYVALQARAQSTWQAFDVNCEAEQFRKPAEAAAQHASR
jgi:hypothetical protein